MQLQQELHTYKQQDDYLSQVKSILAEKEPDLDKLVTMSVEQEKRKSEQKYAKVLEIIRSRDAQISQLTKFKTQYEQQATMLATHAQQFEEYKRQSIDELNKMRNLFKLNNNGKDVEHIEEFKHEIDKLQDQIRAKDEELENYSIIVNSLENK